jgi:hypothetical protein
MFMTPVPGAIAAPRVSAGFHLHLSSEAHVPAESSHCARSCKALAHRAEFRSRLKRLVGCLELTQSTSFATSDRGGRDLSAHDLGAHRTRHLQLQVMQPLRG